MKLLILLLLFSGSFDSNYENDTTSDSQILLIRNFLNDINNDSITIATYLKYINGEYEGYNLDIQCYKRNLSEDSCMLFQKNYCNNPQNISFTLVRLKNRYFANSKISQVTIEKIGACSVYKVFIECHEQEKEWIDCQENNKLFYFVIIKRGRNPDYIYDILDSCLNSIMVG